MKQFEDELEKQLKRALCRQSAPPDFADRVLARIAESPQAAQAAQPAQQESWIKRFTRSFRLAPFNWATPQWAAVGALAVLLIVAVVAFNQHRQEQQRRAVELVEGERAKEQVMLAMRIASEKLNVAQRKVQESSER